MIRGYAFKIKSLGSHICFGEKYEEDRIGGER